MLEVGKNESECRRGRHGISRKISAPLQKSTQKLVHGALAVISSRKPRERNIYCIWSRLLAASRNDVLTAVSSCLHCHHQRLTRSLWSINHGKLGPPNGSFYLRKRHNSNLCWLRNTSIILSIRKKSEEDSGVHFNVKVVLVFSGRRGC